VNRNEARGIIPGHRKDGHEPHRGSEGGIMRNSLATLGKAALSFSLLAVLGARGRAASIAGGTQIQVRLLNKLDTGEAKAGQSFSATVAQPVVVRGRTILARGATVRGRVVEVVSSGRLQKPASITLELTQARGNTLHTQPLRIDAKSHLVRNAELIGGGAGAGALLGALAGGKKGAAIGALVGGGAGTATAYMTGKKEIVLPVEAALTFIAVGASGETGSTTRTHSESRARQSGQNLKSEGDQGEDEGNDEREDGLVFSPHDQEVIRGYFLANTSNLPPGLAKRGGNLPPGLEKHLERDGTLPPGLQKRVEPFPASLEQRLPRLPGGYSRVILGGRALILDRGNKILDIMFIKQ